VIKSRNFISENLEKFTAPILVLRSQTSSNDTIEEAERFIKKIGSKDKTLEIVGSKINQQISFKVTSDQVREIIMSWMVKRAN
jgi:esterase/lipase